MLHIAGADKFCPPEAQAEIRKVLGNNELVTLHVYAEREHALAGLAANTITPPMRNSQILRTLEFLVTHLAGAGLASAQQRLSSRWDDHVKYEFATRNTDDTIETMVPTRT